MNRRVQAPNPIPCARSFGIALPKAVLKHTQERYRDLARQAKEWEGRKQRAGNPNAEGRGPKEGRNPKREIRRKQFASQAAIRDLPCVIQAKDLAKRLDCGD
jgi:hypothetical protein